MEGQRDRQGTRDRRDAPVRGDAPRPEESREPAGPSGTPPSPGAVDRRRHVRLAQLLVGAAAVFLVVTAVGGYGFQWAWTGFADNDTLWDWLQLVLLPVTLACLPLWTLTRATHPTAWWVVIGLLAAALVVLLVGGYGVPWRWTGFAGNTLWDWLKLFLVPFVLPLAVRSMTVHLRPQEPQQRS